MKYFETFPKILYNNTVLTNILKRVGILDSLKENTSIYYEYDFQDGDRLDIISDKMYGDPNRYWIILLSNLIFDPYFGLPLSYIEFSNYIENKYKDSGVLVNKTGLEYALTTIHPDFGYSKIISKINSFDNIVQTKTIYVDQSTYANTGNFQTVVGLPDGTTVTYIESTSTMTIYDWENQLNESKRRIKILDPKYIGQVEKELKSLLNQ